MGRGAHDVFPDRNEARYRIAPGDRQPAALHPSADSARDLRPTDEWSMSDGVGSDLTWDAFGGIGYQFNESVSAIAGYRHLEVDYEHAGFVLDVEMSGPVIGMTVHF